jgi:HlyD family secretion protein
MKPTATSRAISDRELTQARTAREAGAAGLTALEDQIKMKAEGIDMARAELSMAEANVVNADAVVEQKRAALEQANVDLGRTEIRSPIDGIVIKREVNPGQTVAVNLEARMLFQIAKDLREMEVRGRIDEADVGRLQPGQTATFTVDAFPDRTFTGKVLQIRKAPEVVQNVVTYAAIVSAPNPELVLMPGMTANLRIVVSDSGDVLKIPNQALRFRPSQAPPPAAAAKGTHEATVWVLDNANQPSAVKITTGASDSAGTQVLSGALTEGQKVVIGLAAPDKPAQKLGLRLGF